MLQNEFFGSKEECLQLLEDYQGCFDVTSYELKSVDRYLDQWKIVINYKRWGQ